MESPKILTANAWVWNGNLRLAGELKLFPNVLVFNLKDFPQSHLNFEIQLVEIESIKTFLLYGLERNGLHLITRNQKNEYFILENAVEFKQKLKSQLLKQSA